MRFLIADDDFTCRKVLQSMLQDYGTCDVAVNGLEALQAVIKSYEEGNPYHLLCLDIMMPEMDGQDVLVKIREYEASIGFMGENALKIMMTTALGDYDNIMAAFNEQCEAYIVKPLDTQTVMKTIAKLGLLKE